MTHFPRISAVLLISSIVAAPAIVCADTIQITSGAATSRNELTGNPNDLDVVDVTMASPEHGFSLAAAGTASGGLYDLYWKCEQNPACVPGRVASILANWSDSDFMGTATADGATFTVGSEPLGGEAVVEFDGTFTPPPFIGATTTSVIAPFTFTGVVVYPHGFPRVEDTLVGSGLATINLAWRGSNAEAGAWTYTGARYEFAATPEPATLLLVAPCALGVARWRKVTRVEHS
jgi:hypothetical protein